MDIIRGPIWCRRPLLLLTKLLTGSTRPRFDSADIMVCFQTLPSGLPGVFRMHIYPLPLRDGRAFPIPAAAQWRPLAPSIWTEGPRRAVESCCSRCLPPFFPRDQRQDCPLSSELWTARSTRGRALARTVHLVASPGTAKRLWNIKPELWRHRWRWGGDTSDKPRLLPGFTIDGQAGGLLLRLGRVTLPISRWGSPWPLLQPQGRGGSAGRRGLGSPRPPASPGWLGRWGGRASGLRAIHASALTAGWPLQSAHWRCSRYWRSKLQGRHFTKGVPGQAEREGQAVLRLLEPTTQHDCTWWGILASLGLLMTVVAGWATVLGQV